ncbi:hypothetical protein FRAHR75_20047 [Frankia sp. Hr75.2]|nr:hypothetical protein FRAHR75_20047 [Frankia sp. Hr75.2]
MWNRTCISVARDGVGIEVCRARLVCRMASIDQILLMVIAWMHVVIIYGATLLKVFKNSPLGRRIFREQLFLLQVIRSCVSLAAVGRSGIAACPDALTEGGSCISRTDSWTRRRRWRSAWSRSRASVTP